MRISTTAASLIYCSCLVANWNRQKKAAMISGMALFLKTYEAELDDYVFVQRLSPVTAEEIIRRSRTDFSTNKVALRVGRVILSKYNKAHGTKLPYRFAG